MVAFSPRYNPHDVEERLYQQWESQGLFRAEPDAKRAPYTIVIPPPNVTGILHMGHALNNTIQDILIRFKRMQGDNALWVPGTDHAGIATQNVVEKQLAKEGTRRQDLGREAFVQRVWQWREQYGSTIIKQLKRLGASCDWQRTRFTMDEGLSEAVLEVFVRLYDKGLIYRGHYIINWCPRCQTALADEEAPRKETRGKLWYIRYPLRAQREHIVVATTRPETMLGDTAIAVHPKDKRYKHLIGQKAVLPLVNRELPIIADELVDPDFGTGAVKVTPAHDPVDFQLAKRHDLQILNIMTGDGRMENVPEPFNALDRFECRKRVLEALEQQNALEKTVDHLHGVGHCYRCDTVVEPRLSPQWFVKMQPLAKPAIKAVKDGTIKFVPSRWTKVYLNWMENIQDWCISRQIWWGHRIPVWYCNACLSQTTEIEREGDVKNITGRAKPLAADKKQPGVIVSKVSPEKCPTCGSVVGLHQDEDVLDTWFSSWLWPFSTLGWPQKTKDVAYFYPTNTLVTAPEIIFFWVARMIMAGYFCMGKPPFTKVYIHGTVRDLTGKKMSKSLGNIIDPLDIIGKYGTDALRYTLITSTAIGQDIFLSEDKFTVGRNFANKLWNVTRYVLLTTSQANSSDQQLSKSNALSTADRWILSRLHHTIGAVTKALDRFDFNGAAQALYDLIWRDYCDWYVEYSKLVSEPQRAATYCVLREVLDTSLRLLHPIMPFVTEELWQHLSQASSIMTAPWPKTEKRWIDSEAEHQFELFKGVVTAIRTMRAELNVPIDTRPPARFSAKDDRTRQFLEAHRPFVQALAQIGEVAIGEALAKSRDAAATVVDGIEVILPLTGVIDASKERQRLQTRISELSEELSRLEAKLKDRQFVQRAPKEVVAQTKARRTQVDETLQKFSGHLKLVESL